MPINTPSNSKSADFQRQVAELAKQYRQQLPVKLGDILSGWDKLRARWDQDLAELLHRTAHGMAGSAGTMGLPQAGEAARALEKMLKRVLANPEELPDQREQIAAAVSRLDAVIKRDLGLHAAVADLSALPVLPPLKILVADDDADGRNMLLTLLQADGYTVLAAENGEQAVRMFEQETPDMVLMDVIMPGMNGYEAARLIKERCGKHFVPLIFLTALSDEKDLVACIDAGGDDFMVKPYNRLLLRAKLIAMHRIRELHRQLERHQRKTEEEIALSQHVFETATNRNEKSAAIEHWHAAVGHFCGDLALYARSPMGRFFVLQGDFTGHGLAAALGALPLSDLFYALVEDETSLPDLVAGLNRKLKLVLPLGHFCAVCIVVAEADGSAIEAWNGGLPGAWVLDRDNRVIERLESDKMPLGILDDASFDMQTRRLSLPPHARVLLFSDGLSEAAGASGVPLGEEGVERELLLANSDNVAQALREAVADHLNGAEAHDDISITVLDPSRYSE